MTHMHTYFHTSTQEETSVSVVHPFLPPVFNHWHSSNSTSLFFNHQRQSIATNMDDDRGLFFSRMKEGVVQINKKVE